MNAVIYIAAALAALCAVLLVIVITKLGRLSAGDGQIKELESKISSLEVSCATSLSAAAERARVTRRICARSSPNRSTR